MPLLLRRSLLLHLLLRLHLLKHCSAPTDNLPDPHLEVELAVFGETRRRSGLAEGEALRHREAIFAAVLHPGHCLGETRKDLVHREGLRAAVAVAAVDDAAV